MAPVFLRFDVILVAFSRGIGTTRVACPSLRYSSHAAYRKIGCVHLLWQEHSDTKPGKEMCGIFCIHFAICARGSISHSLLYSVSSEGGAEKLACYNRCVILYCYFCFICTWNNSVITGRAIRSLSAVVVSAPATGYTASAVQSLKAAGRHLSKRRSACYAEIPAVNDNKFIVSS